MKHKAKNWSKQELQLYILFMCANADNNETEKELTLIASKVDKYTFDKMFDLFKNDTEEKRFKKIDRNIQLQNYSVTELNDFKKEIYEVFLIDNNFSMLEKRLDWTLDNILY